MDKEKIAVLALALCSFSVLTFAQGVTVNEVKIEPYGSGKLKIEWKSIAGEFIAFYSIRRDGVIVGKAFSPPFIDSDLENGKEYEYVVEAVGTNGDTAAISDPVKAVALEKFTGCESAEINCFDGFDNDCNGRKDQEEEACTLGNQSSLIFSAITAVVGVVIVVLVINSVLAKKEPGDEKKPKNRMELVHKPAGKKKELGEE